MSELDLYSVKHLKLSSGEEVLAEVIEEDSFDVVLRRAETPHRNREGWYTTFFFRTFMTYMDDPETFCNFETA